MQKLFLKQRHQNKEINYSLFDINIENLINNKLFKELLILKFVIENV